MHPSLYLSDNDYRYYKTFIDNFFYDIIIPRLLFEFKSEFFPAEGRMRPKSFKDQSLGWWSGITTIASYDEKSEMVEILDELFRPRFSRIGGIDSKRVDTQGLPAPYAVTSDPLDSDTDNDGVPDGNERAELSDPTKTDSDGDTFLDGEESQYGSTIAGRESGVPTMSKYIDPSTSWKNRYWNGIWCGKKLETNIEVQIWGYDLAGIQDIYVKVVSSGRFGSKSDDERQTGDHFDHKFGFDFNLKSVVTEVWSGWDVRIEVKDTNDNIGYQDEHINSGVQTLVDWVAEALEELMDAILEWLWERIRNMINLAFGPVLDAVSDWQKGYINTLKTATSEYDETGQISDGTLADFEGYIHGDLYYILAGIACIITAAFILINVVTAGTSSIISTGISLIAGVILGLFLADTFIIDIDWSLGTDPIMSSLEKAYDFCDEHAASTYLNFPQFIVDTIIGTLSSFIALGLAENTGTTASVISFALAICSLGISAITHGDILPIVWFIGLIISFIAFGLGLIGVKGSSPSAKQLSLIASGISAVGLGTNLINLGGYY